MSQNEVVKEIQVVSEVPEIVPNVPSVPVLYYHYGEETIAVDELLISNSANCFLVTDERFEAMQDLLQKMLSDLDKMLTAKMAPQTEVQIQNFETAICVINGLNHVVDVRSNRYRCISDSNTLFELATRYHVIVLVVDAIYKTIKQIKELAAPVVYEECSMEMFRNTYCNLSEHFMCDYEMCHVYDTQLIPSRNTSIPVLKHKEDRSWESEPVVPFDCHTELKLFLMARTSLYPNEHYPFFRDRILSMVEQNMPADWSSVFVRIVHTRLLRLNQTMLKNSPHPPEFTITCESEEPNEFKLWFAVLTGVTRSRFSFYFRKEWLELVLDFLKTKPVQVKCQFNLKTMGWLLNNHTPTLKMLESRIDNNISYELVTVHKDKNPMVLDTTVQQIANFSPVQAHFFEKCFKVCKSHRRKLLVLSSTEMREFDLLCADGRPFEAVCKKHHDILTTGLVNLMSVENCKTFITTSAESPQQPQPLLLQVVNELKKTLMNKPDIENENSSLSQIQSLLWTHFFNEAAKVIVACLSRLPAIDGDCIIESEKFVEFLGIATSLILSLGLQLDASTEAPMLILLKTLYSLSIEEQLSNVREHLYDNTSIQVGSFMLPLVHIYFAKKTHAEIVCHEYADMFRFEQMLKTSKCMQIERLDVPASEVPEGEVPTGEVPAYGGAIIQNQCFWLRYFNSQVAHTEGCVRTDTRKRKVSSIDDHAQFLELQQEALRLCEGHMFDLN